MVYEDPNECVIALHEWLKLAILNALPMPNKLYIKVQTCNHTAIDHLYRKICRIQSSHKTKISHSVYGFSWDDSPAPRRRITRGNTL